METGHTQEDHDEEKAAIEKIHTGKIDISGNVAEHNPLANAPDSIADLHEKANSKITTDKIIIPVDSFPQYSEAEIGIHVNSPEKNQEAIKSGRDQANKFDDVFPDDKKGAKKDDKKAPKKAEPKKKGGGLFGLFKKKEPVEKKKADAKKGDTKKEEPARPSLLDKTAEPLDPLKNEDIDIEMEPISDKKATDTKIAADDTKTPEKAKVSKEPEHKDAGPDIHHDINGNYHKAAWNEEKPDNCAVKFGRRLFNKWYPYHPVLAHTDWA